MTPDQRSQLVEAAAWAETFEHGAVGHEIAEAVLDALLAFRFPCPECEGTTNANPLSSGVDQDCPTCNGSGEADSPRIALVEQVGFRVLDPRVAAPVFVELVVPDQEDAKP